MVTKYEKLIRCRHIEHLTPALGGSVAVHIRAGMPIRMRKGNVSVLQGIGSD